MELKNGDQPVKPKKMLSLVLLLFANLTMFASVTISFYALLTLNYQLMAILLTFTIAQLFVKKSQTFVNFVTKHAHPSEAFNSFKVIDDWKENSASEQQYLTRCMYAFHPHSVFAAGFVSSMNLSSEPAFCNMTGLSTIFMLLMPFTGLILKLWGVQAVSNSNFKKLLKEGKNVGFLPGGFEQQTITSPDEMRIWINQRKGFIKYALQYKYTIRPVIVLKQHQSFWTSDLWQKFRLSLNVFRISAVFFWSRKFFNFQPSNFDVTVIKGRPINHNQDKKGFQPSGSLVDAVHKEYIEEIKRLYGKYKSLNSDKPLKLY